MFLKLLKMELELKHITVDVGKKIVIAATHFFALWLAQMIFMADLM